MRTRRSPFLFGLVSLILFNPSSFGWSYKEHILFTRMAVTRLLNDPTTPPAMKAWLGDAIGQVHDMPAFEGFYLHTRVGREPVGMTGLSYWSYMPDVHASKDPVDLKIQPFNVRERPLHFIDLELMLPDDRKREYKHDLSNKPRLSDLPRDMTDPRYVQAGMLPFRIEQCYQQLVVSIRKNRLHAPTHEAQEHRTATYWAGYLAHYLADNTQPHHSTIDFQSQMYFADKRQGKYPNIHSEMEYRMCDDEKNDYMALRRDYWPMFVHHVEHFKDPVQTADPWLSSVETSLLCYDALPLIGLAAMHAAGQGGTPDRPEGTIIPEQFDTEAFFCFKGHYMGREMTVLEMKAIQTAWAVKRIERFYRQAWDEAQPRP
jgi:hypothetical protein